MPLLPVFRRLALGARHAPAGTDPRRRAAQGGARRLTTDEAERAFVARIDARFPLHDAAAARALLDEACRLSANAVLTVVYELACLPRGVDPRTTRALRLELLDAIAPGRCAEREVLEALWPVVAPLARARIDGRTVPAAEVLAAIARIAAYPGQHQALNVATAAADPDDAIDAADAAVRARWPTRAP